MIIWNDICGFGIVAKGWRKGFKKRMFQFTEVLAARGIVDRYRQVSIYSHSPMGLGRDEVEGNFRLLVLGNFSQHKFGEE